MTIKQMAAKHKVSPQAVYQRLKKQGVNVNSLMDKETQELSPEGEMILDQLFDKKIPQIKVNSTAFAEEQNKRITDLNIEIATLREKIDNLEREKKALTEERDFLRAALVKAQDNQTETLKLLPGAGGTTAPAESVRLTWKERFTGRLARNK